MKKYTYIFIVLFTVVLASSCESYQIHGDLDGFWQVQSIENKESGEITYCNGDIYYSFQRDLVLASYVSPTIPQGLIKNNYIAHFTQENDSIYMTDFRIYLDREGKQAPLSELEKFGLHNTFNTFGIEKLSRSSLILNSDKARIVLQKY